MTTKHTGEECEICPPGTHIIDCTCPAQKEDPFGDFMKSQGVNVVDVTPTQKEEWVEEYDELPSSFYRAPSHRDDCEGLVAGDIGLPCTCTTQKEEWVNDRNLQMIGVISLFQSKVYDTEQLHKEMEEIFKKDCLSQISQAEARGREATITAFEEWAKGHYWDTLDKDIVLLHLLSFADSLKKKHETN